MSIDDVSIAPTKENLQLYIDSGGDLTATTFKERYTLLHLAIRHHYLDIARWLINKSVYLCAKDIFGYTPLDYTFKYSEQEGALLLIDSGIDINGKYMNGDTPLHLAIKYKYLETAQRLLDKGADVHVIDEDGYTTLHLAVGNKLKKIAFLLIIKGVNIHAVDRYAQTALHLALYNNLPEIAGVLINDGADINIKNIYGYTPLHLAIRCIMPEIARVLISSGADIHAMDDSRNTPLHLALIYKMPEIVHILIDFYKDVSAKNDIGNTPLHLAYACKLSEIARLLISKGADTSIKNNFGWVPSMIKYERIENRVLLDNLISFVSKIITRRLVNGESRFRFKSITLCGSSKGRFYKYANTKGKHYIDELSAMAGALGCDTTLSKREYCKYIAERLEAYTVYTKTDRCNRYRSVIGKTVILQNDVDFLHEPIEDAIELYILLDTNDRYYGFSRADYKYLETHKVNPHSKSSLTDEQVADIYNFFEMFDGKSYEIYKDLIN